MDRDVDRAETGAVKVTSISVGFRGTISLPGYNSIGVEFAETVAIDEGEDPVAVRAERFAAVKEAVAEALRQSKPKPKAADAEEGPYK